MQIIYEKGESRMKISEEEPKMVSLDLHLLNYIIDNNLNKEIINVYYADSCKVMKSI